MPMYATEVTMEDFAGSFGATVDDISEECRKTIAENDFSYRSLDKDERDRIILEVLKRIESDTQVIGTEERKEVWEKGWSENLSDFMASGCRLDALVPKFIRENQPIRYKSDYILPANPRFEYHYMTAFRIWLFQKFFSRRSRICEFGCGTGLNLVLLANLFPEKDLVGLDFVQSSVDLVNAIHESHGLRLTGRLFDMIHPDDRFMLGDDCAVLTFGAVEQLAGNFEAFLQYLLRQRPKICIHMEPTIELYDENNLVDYLAIRFHRKRGYTEGLLPRLQQLEAQGKIELLKVKRLFFGSLFMEGYSYFVWKPV